MSSSVEYRWVVGGSLMLVLALGGTLWANMDRRVTKIEEFTDQRGPEVEVLKVQLTEMEKRQARMESKLDLILEKLDDYRRVRRSELGAFGLGNMQTERPRRSAGSGDRQAP